MSMLGSKCCCRQGCRCQGVYSFESDPSIFCASGALMGGNCVTSVFDKPFFPCCCGESVYMDIIDSGCYANAISSFPRAISGSFDSVALKEGYVVCMYANPDFRGSPFLVARGPIIVNNSHWRRTYYPSQFENYRMAWSTVDMYFARYWQYPGSIAIGKWDRVTEINETGFFLDD